ncbi:probable peptidyl-tRNA hydrolase 2 [Ylistrum balloti]|uniref:probable peptidyl-tRNA hydrolase 2 n=1 Tax=Ylistrum balloti TaxID=509963 RepID=UPI002905DD38|nr:probable peptidyl-tRNA hydrolase 2 [Ylistrum balloti]
MDASVKSSESEDSSPTFKPVESLVQVLVQSLAFSRNAAIKGLYYTGNYNADLAAAWIMDNQEKPDLDSPLQEDAGDSDDSEEDYFPEGVDFYKMVFVVNAELNMGVGKIAAQAAHAALGLHRILLETPQKYGQMLMSWEQFGETKIVVKGDNSTQLMDLTSKAEGLGLPNYLVHDAGKTQIAAGSVTVLGIMGKIDVVDSVTGSLKLL